MSFDFEPSAFRFNFDEISYIGETLSRPECVLCNAAGDIFVSRWEGGGVTRIRPDGTEIDIVTNKDNVGTNGFAITPEGDFLLANLHVDGGGVWLLKKDGSSQPFLLEIDGRKLPPANFVGMDRTNRIWISISTWHEPRTKAFRPDVSDGFIILVTNDGARIVAEGLGYTNEAIVDNNNSYIYVNETFGRRTSRFRIRKGNSLGPRETVTEYGYGTFPDGLAFDEKGGLWVTSVISNRLIYVAPDGHQTIVLEDNQPETLNNIEQAFMSGQLGHEHINSMQTKNLLNISSIAFGGSDRKTIYLGNLQDNRIYALQSPVAGIEPSHWHVAI